MIQFVGAPTSVTATATNKWSIYTGYTKPNIAIDVGPDSSNNFLFQNGKIKINKTGKYLVGMAANIYSTANGDICHIGLINGSKVHSIATDWQITCDSNPWHHINGVLVTEIKAGSLLALGYRCEQGFGSKCNFSSWWIIDITTG